MELIELPDAPIFLFGGPYSNLQATLAALDLARRLDIPASRVFCTGDIVAYGADARPCVDLLREAGVASVMGNCEEQLAAGAADCGCGFAPGGVCDRLSRDWFSHASGQMDEATRGWFATLPRRIDIALGGARLAIFHGAPDAISRFIYASTPARVKRLALDMAGVDGVIAGHCGLPFTNILDGRLWHNPGAIGLPANDGTPRGWCSVITPPREGRGFNIQHIALDYDHGAAARAMRAAGLPEAYAAALETGLWPSCESLPTEETKAAGKALAPGCVEWRTGDAGKAENWPPRATPTPMPPVKFVDPVRTAAGEPRAHVALERLETLWINTGTQCNLSCASCYIESTPTNDRLAYLSAAEAVAYLDEIHREGLPTRRVGFTGGEPFLNRDFPAMLADALERGLDALVLTNAMKPMRLRERELLALRDRHGERLTVRVSIDHYTRELHELERGPRSWAPTIEGATWLAREGFRLEIAGRLYSGETDGVARAGYAALFAELGLPVDAFDPVALTLFPEMDARRDTPEITEACWDILGKRPADVMCATSRMVVKRKGASRPAVLACTLLAYDPQFELGEKLAEAARPVSLNHPHCSTFCVLGGAACSR
jgi:uncharacterized radical SAM superfamily Fe-S cluster-containing enzyme